MSRNKKINLRHIKDDDPDVEEFKLPFVPNPVLKAQRRLTTYEIKKFEIETKTGEEGDVASLSLDEVIKHMKVNNKNENREHFENESDIRSVRSFSSRASAMGKPRQRKMTPIGCLKMISETTLGRTIKIEQTCREINAEQNEGVIMTQDENRSHRWRVEYYWGDQLKGFGEAPRKILARQVAAKSLVVKIKDAFPDEIDLPAATNIIIPQGCFISPFINTLLDRVAEDKGFSKPVYNIEIIPSQGMGQNKTDLFYKCTCTVGDKNYTKIDGIESYARRQVAKFAYESITETTFPPDTFFSDDNEEMMDASNFSFVESETTHVIKLPGIKKLNKPDINGEENENEDYGKEDCKPGPVLTQLRLLQRQVQKEHLKEDMSQFQNNKKLKLNIDIENDNMESKKVVTPQPSDDEDDDF